MSEATRSSPSPGVLLAVPLLGLLLWRLHAASVGRLMDDFDGAWHLACGRWLVERGEVPRVDPFCFTSTGLDWINLNWLAQVALYGAFRWRGFEATQALAALGLAAALAAMALALRARGARPALLVLALSPLSPLWPTLVAAHSIRPQTGTFALLALTVWVLERPDPDLRLGWRRAAALAATLLAWIHLHGGFVFGFALLALDAAGSCADARAVVVRARWLAGVLAAGVLGFALHPHGLDALTYALTYTRALGPQLETVPELMPLDLSGRLGRVVLAYVAVAVAGYALARRRPRARDALVFVAFLVLTLKVRRAAIPLVLATLPAVVAAWTAALDRLALGARLDALLAPTARALPLVPPAGALAWALVVALLARPGVPGQVSAPPFDPRVVPVNAVAALQRLEGQGRVFTLYSAGGLLDWALYPARRTFVDGRGDLHARGPAYDEYLRIGRLEPGWKERLDAWQVDLALLGQGAPLAKQLALEHGWRPVHVDERWVILARPRRR